MNGVQYREDVTGELGYLQLMAKILAEGERVKNRTGVDTLSLFGEQIKFDLQSGFPLLTTKKMSLRWIMEELLWFIRGETHVGSLQGAGVNIWDEWSTAEKTSKFGRPEGYLGPIYGHQWRNFGATLQEDRLTYNKDGFDQLGAAIGSIRQSPDSRRIIVSAWHPIEASEVELPPCHSFFQFRVVSNSLSTHLYMRSADYFLGVPFNVASYALLTHLVAHVCGLEVGKLVVSFGDVHLYQNHLDVVETQLSRTPHVPPRLDIVRKVGTIDEFAYEDLRLSGYTCHGRLQGEVAV